MIRSACWIFLAAICLPHVVSGQYKSVEIDRLDVASAPSIAISAKNPLLQVVALKADLVYQSADGGKTWQKQQLNSSFGNTGNAVVACDGKNTFYLLYLSDSKIDPAFSSGVVCHVSSDGGKTWDNGTLFGSVVGKKLNKVSATVDPKGHVWAAWTQSDAEEGGSCTSTVLVSNSSSGKRWSKPVPLATATDDCNTIDKRISNPVIVPADEKRVFVTWANAKQIYLDRSFDAGTMWLSNDILLEEQKGGWNLDISGHELANAIPLLSMDLTKSERRGLLYLGWADDRSGDGNADIYFSRSNNFGDIWTPPSKVNDDEGKAAQYMPAMAIDNVTGFIYFLYFDRRDHEDNQTDVYLAISRNSGQSFENVKISEASFKPVSSDPVRQTAIAAHNGSITAVWLRQDENGFQLMSSVFQDGQPAK